VTCPIFRRGLRATSPVVDENLSGHPHPAVIRLRAIFSLASRSWLWTASPLPHLMFGITHRENHRQPRPAKIQSSTLLEDGPCYGGMSHAPLLGDRPGALALGEALASDTAPDAASDEPRAASPQACGASPVAPQHLADIGGGRPQRLLGDGKAKWPSGSSSEEVAPTLPRCAVAIRRAVTGPPFRSGR
jgi:hypothetical protein